MKSNKLRYFVAGLLTCVVFICMGQVAFANTYVKVSGEIVNVRSSPEINDYNLITTLPRGTKVQVVGVANSFFRAILPDIGYVYVSQSLVRFYQTRGTIVTPAAWVFDLPDTYYGSPIGLSLTGDYFAVVSYYGDWFGVIYEGELAFIEKHHMYVPCFIEVPPARLNDYANSDIIEQVIAKALRYLGTPYQWGGNGPNSFDCSGFVIYVLRPFGVTLPRRSRDMASSGVHVNRSDIQAGDLVFFATAGGRTVSHVGLYIGGGQFIHSSSTRSGGVIISSINSAYFTRTFVTARRVL